MIADCAAVFEISIRTGLLTFVETADGSSDGCLNDVVISGSNGSSFSVEISDCNTLVIEGGLVEPVYGCTDSDACNFNSLANTDNGTCEYPADGFNCAGECIIGEDCAGVCGGDAEEDCAGDCGGSAELLECGCNEPLADGACDDRCWTEDCGWDGGILTKS